jgi:hypothetical protein
MKRAVIPTVEPWSFEHWIGAVVVLAIAAGLALNFWPGWERLLHRL